MVTKILLKMLPYFAALVTGIFFYLLAININSNYYDLLLNISATFFAIPFLYFFYETAKSFSTKRLNQEIFDYAKMQIDREVMSTLNQLQKIIYTLDEKKPFSSKSIDNLLLLSENDISCAISENMYLGFQILKHWEITEEAFHDILKNPFILDKLDNEQIISIIQLLKNIRKIQSMQRINDLYIDSSEKAKGFKIQSGIELNADNLYPQRYLLLKQLKDDKYVVLDFGDIHKYNLERCLNYHKVNPMFLDDFSKTIFELLESINNWLKITGCEFIIDTKNFRYKYVESV